MTVLKETTETPSRAQISIINFSLICVKILKMAFF